MLFLCREKLSRHATVGGGALCPYVVVKTLFSLLPQRMEIHRRKRRQRARLLKNRQMLKRQRARHRYGQITGKLEMARSWLTSNARAMGHVDLTGSIATSRTCRVSSRSACSRHLPFPMRSGLIASRLSASSFIRVGQSRRSCDA